MDSGGELVVIGEGFATLSGINSHGRKREHQSGNHRRARALLLLDSGTLSRLKPLLSTTRPSTVIGL